MRDKLSVAFHERGQQLVAQVSAIMAARADESTKPDEPLFFVDALARAVGNTASLPAQAEELRTAVRDMFEEPFGAAFEWLARLCAAYVALCALGFEYQSGKALARLLAKVTLVLDTDIVLSLLGEGEPNHSDVEGLVRRWIALGGSVLVSAEVLHEVAHHAAIADYDYNQVRHWLPGSQQERLRLINNVFVRAFGALLEQQRTTARYWDKFIGQYRRGTASDSRRIAEVLAQEYGIRELPPATSAERRIEEAARAFLQARAALGKEGQQAWIASDKAKRDASLYAAIVREARSSRAADPDRACLLVSSARLLSEVEDELREVGEPQLVVSLGAAFFLLSLVPGVSLGVGAMQTLLFDLHSRLSNDLERVVLRIVHDSAELSIPWAKRPALLRELRTRLYRDADRSPSLDPRSPEARAIEKAALNDSRLQRTAAILKESLAAVAADQRLERENAQLRDVVAALERQLESLQKQRSTTRAKS